MEKSQKLNPVEYFPVEITVEIFSYLKAKDLCTASLVSKAWYDLIADSRKCMKKITVRVRCNQISIQSKKFLLVVESKRRYENLELYRCNNCVQDVTELFFSRTKKWKRVKMTKTLFKDVNQVLDVLACIEETVEVLELYDIKTMDDYSDRRRRGFSFPKLRIFRAVGIPIRLFHEAFELVESLQYFELFSNGQTVASLNALVKILSSNRKLKFWDVSSNVFNQIIYQHDLKPNFKLEELSVTSVVENSPFFDVVRKNLAALIRSQKGSLKTLSLGNWMGMDVLNAAFEIEGLKSLIVSGDSKDIQRDIDQHRYLQLKTNNSLLDLSILITSNDIEFLKKVTAAAPNLISFIILRLDEPLMKHMSANNKNLRLLSVVVFTPSEISSQDFFKSLTHVYLKSYRTRLARNIASKSHEKRSNFEKLLAKYLDL